MQPLFRGPSLRARNSMCHWRMNLSHHRETSLSVFGKRGSSFHLSLSSCFIIDLLVYRIKFNIEELVSEANSKCIHHLCFAVLDSIEFNGQITLTESDIGTKSCRRSSFMIRKTVCNSQVSIWIFEDEISTTYAATDRSVDNSTNLSRQSGDWCQI